MRRLRKVLALSKSSSPGEAAAALHQASKMMKQYGISAGDLDALDIVEKSSNLSACDLPAWEGALASVVCRSVSVQVIVQAARAAKGVRRPRAQVVFIGRGVNAEIAAYAFESLRRQLKRDLSAALLSLVNQGGQEPETQISSLRGYSIPAAWREKYAIGWCSALAEKITALLPQPDEDAALAAHVQSRTNGANVSPKSAAKRKNSLSSAFVSMGFRDGEKVEIHKAVNAGKPVSLIG